MKLKHYAELLHFYQSGGPFYDTVIIEINERDATNLPLQNIYAFRYFDSSSFIDSKDFFKNIINPSKWYYIGTYQDIRQYKEYNYDKGFPYKEVIDTWEQAGVDVVLDGNIPGIVPMGIMLKDTETILNPTIRENNSMRLGSYKKTMRWNPKNMDEDI